MISASALSTPPPVSPPAEVSMTEITPRTAARVATLADAHDKALDVATQRVGAPKPKKARLLTADDELELADEDFAAPNDDESDLLGEERYIPSNPDIVRLQKIVGDPASHFLPTIKVGSTTMFYAGPQGLAPELAELFNFPATILRRERGEEQEQRQAKRPRLEAPQEEDVEVGRRQSVIPSEPRFHIGEFGGDETFGGSGDDHGLDFTAPEVGVPTFLTPRGKRAGQQEEREPSLAPSRAESIARQVQFGGDVDHPLAMFDTRASRTETGESLAQIQSQSLGTPSKSIISEERVTRGGYSKNTGMALGLLRRELEAIEEEDKVLRFERVANKVGLISP
jgi:cohesin complex subunit SCC1